MDNELEMIIEDVSTNEEKIAVRVSRLINPKNYALILKAVLFQTIKIDPKETQETINHVVSYHPVLDNSQYSPLEIVPRS